MAKICCSSFSIAIASKGSLKIFSTDDGSCLFSYTHQYDKAVMDGNGKPLDDRLEDMCVSPNGKYYCAMYSDKKLIVVSTELWIITIEIKVKRRPTAMTFDPTEKWLLVADKSGDLYQYDIDAEVSKKRKEDVNDEDEQNDPQPVLGHVSMLLDVKVSQDGKYIITADRDEKIRVSSFGSPYVIESFCLGHTEFVCRIQPVSLEGKCLIISTSGDGTIRLWDAVTGKEHGKCNFAASDSDSEANGHCLERHESKGSLVPAFLACDSNGSVAVASDRSDGIRVSTFIVDKGGPSLTCRASFTLPECERILNLCFGDHGCILFVLMVSKDQKLCVLAYECCNGFCKPVADASTLVTVNMSIREFAPPDCAAQDWECLFKTRCEGEAYSSYHKRKEERLAAKNKVEENNIAAKRVKLSG